MDIRHLTDRYCVAPQLEPGEMKAVAEAGFKAVICNRPDEEVPGPLQMQAMREAAEEAGLAFHELPLTHRTLGPELARRQREIAESVDGPVLAYCASGTRSTIAWALGQAGSMPVKDILGRARDGGYDLSTMRAALEAEAAGK